MDTYFMFGKYSARGFREIISVRTREVRNAIEQLGGRLCEMYALIGVNDIVLIVELPGIAEVVKAALAVGRVTGITFSTSQAVSVEQFDRMAEDMAMEIASARMEARK